MPGEIFIFPNLDELSRAAAQKFVEIAQKAIAVNNRFTVALAGGSTPKNLYRLLADENEPFCSRIEWEKCFFFWGDERFVPPDSNESNFKMANETLLAPLNIPQENIFRFQTEFEPDMAAENYGQTLREFFDLNENELPRFDLILLGLGADAHTASLFPESEAVSEKSKHVAFPFVEKLNSFRLTLTPPVLNNAANVAFLISGAEKADALRNVLEGDFQPQKFPAQIIRPTNGNLLWFVDSQAAKRLSRAEEH